MKRLGTVVVLAVLISMLVNVLPVAAATPSATNDSVPAASSLVYYVMPGDTLTRIAYRFSTTIWTLLRANPAIYNPNRIYIGQRLVVPMPANVFTQVKVALIALNDGGNVGCGDSVVMVTRQVPATRAPLTAAIRELLSIKQQSYGQSGLYDALYQSNLQIASIAINNGVATIRLTGQLMLGGVCDNPRVAAQLEQTARQFSTVKSIDIYVNGTPLQTVLSEKGM